MSVRLMALAWECEGLDTYERIVLLSLADHAGDDGTCYPSIARICRRASMSDRSIYRVLRRLSDRGLIEVESGGGRHVRNRYVIRINPDTQSPFAAENPDPVSPFQARNPDPERQNPDPERQNPDPESPQPSRTIKNQEKKQNARAREVLASVVGDDRADAFLAHRKGLKAPMTDHAADLMAKRLATMADPGSALDRSIENGWKGVFEDGRPNGRHPPQPTRAEADTDAFIAGARRF